MQRKQIGPRLITDAQQVLEPLSDQQEHRLAFAFQKRIGRHGGAHFYRFDRPIGNRRTRSETHQITNALFGGVPVAFGIGRQQFMTAQRPIGGLGHDIGKGAATVDPKFPLRLRHMLFPQVLRPQIMIAASLSRGAQSNKIKGAKA